MYLSLDENGEQQKVLALGGRWPRMRLLWGGAAAAVALVGSLTVAKYELFRTRRAPTATAHQTSEYAKIADERAPAELDRLRPGAVVKKAPPASAKVLPEAKHMEAKPRAKLDFDQSGQVRVTSPQVSAPGAARKLERPPAGAFRGLTSENREVSAEAAGNAAKEKDVGAAERADVLARAAAEPRAAQMSPAPMALGKAGTRVVKERNSEAAERMAVSRTTPLFEWTLSPAGALLRSADQGTSWQLVTAQPGALFRALSAVGADVWVGGANGSLYHSSDSGQSWEKVVPVDHGRKLETEVIRLDFSDRLNGTLTTAAGELWKTSDAGETWRVQ
ncbi:MAG: hypothetical protein JO159_00955 [Acidobacteria bacterium]|nr:hypothetical protein [Acidobacteriota bacterium]